SVASPDAPHTPPLLRMRRVQSWGTDLDRLTRVDGIFNDVVARRCTIEAARASLRELESHPPPYPAWLGWAATAAVSGAAAVFFRGGLLEIGLAALVGVCIAAFGRVMKAHPSGRYLVDFVGAFLSAVFAWGIAHWVPRASVEVLVLSGVIA